MGTTLYKRLIPTLAAQGFRTLIAVITVPNPPSERLHEQFGFRKTGVLHRIGWKFGQWHDVAYWQRTLRDDDDAPEPVQTVADVISPAQKVE